MQTTFQYDPLNRVKGMSSAIGGYTYQLGPTGNRSSALEQNGRAVTWSYDGIYRLTGESITSAPSKNNGSVSYGLDPVGRVSQVSLLRPGNPLRLPFTNQAHALRPFQFALRPPQIPFARFADNFPTPAHNRSTSGPAQCSIPAPCPLTTGRYPPSPPVPGN